MQNLTMPIEQAFNLIDQALSQLSANRETHVLLASAVQRIRDETETLRIQKDLKGDSLEIR